MKTLTNTPPSKLILYSPTQNTGIAIPYPSISLHAIQRPNSVLLQLTAEERSGDRDDDGDEEGSVSLSVIPSAAGANTQEEDTEAEGEEGDEREEAQEIFEALSACAELHPDRDPMDEGGLGGGGGWGIFDGADEGGQGEGETGNGAYEQVSGQGLPPPMPGSGGWITAENMGEMLDEEGNLRGLGEGAGRVRDRGEAEEGEDGEREDEDGEGKWRRTE